jgi:hypothetical protein
MNIKFCKYLFVCNCMVWINLQRNKCIEFVLPSVIPKIFIYLKSSIDSLHQCFSTAETLSGTGPWHQFYRAARGSPGSCHFSVLSIFLLTNIL